MDFLKKHFCFKIFPFLEQHSYRLAIYYGLQK